MALFGLTPWRINAARSAALLSLARVRMRLGSMGGPGGGGGCCGISGTSPPCCFSVSAVFSVVAVVLGSVIVLAVVLIICGCGRCVQDTRRDSLTTGEVQGRDKKFYITQITIESKPPGLKSPTLFVICLLTPQFTHATHSRKKQDTSSNQCQILPRSPTRASTNTITDSTATHKDGSAWCGCSCAVCPSQPAV